MAQSQNYSTAYLDAIDERFSLESKTDIVINNGMRLDFNGRNSVTIYNVDVVPETDYIRNGPNRFGALVELGTGVQTFILSQDKAFTFTVDRGNLEDSMMAQEASKSVKRQVREVSVPATDVYRLAVLCAYAVANSQTATVALTNSNTYASVLTQQAALDDLLVPEDERVMFCTPTTLNLMKRDPEFRKASDSANADIKKGIVGDVDGLTIVKVPTTYLPANSGFLIVHKNVLVSPTKFNMVRVLTDVQGVDGSVAEGRRYYDAFIPTNKGPAIRLHKIA